MTDWADEIAMSLDVDTSRRPARFTFLRSTRNKVAAALRKAKADGMREAEAVIQAKADSYAKDGTYIQADILADYATELGCRANQIEKGE